MADDRLALFLEQFDQPLLLLDQRVDLRGFVVEERGNLRSFIKTRKGNMIFGDKAICDTLLPPRAAAATRLSLLTTAK